MNSEKNHKYLFGPVPSRRLGRSLGIDLVPFKTCTFDCIYCQLGRTTVKTTARKEYVPTGEILDELAGFLKKSRSGIDYLTLSGSGEPTLHSGLEQIIASIKKMTDIPIAVLTNGSLLHDRSVRRELAKADVVLPTLAADSETVFQCVHRPEPSLSFKQHVEGIIRFSGEFRNQLWLELFLLQGITAMEKNVAAMNRIIEKIKPEKIQINTASRPPCEEFAFPVPEKRLRELSKLITGGVEIVAEKENLTRRKYHTATHREILELIRRRPCTAEDAATGLTIHASEAAKMLSHLVHWGKATISRRNQKTYYKGIIL